MSHQPCNTCSVPAGKREGYCTQTFNVGRRNAMSHSQADIFMKDLIRRYRRKSNDLPPQPFVFGGGVCPLYQPKGD